MLLVHCQHLWCIGTLTPEQGVNLFAARMVGRWKSGAPIDLAPVFDDPALGDDWHRNNNFDYSAPDSIIASPSDQMKCPFSAHTRKTRPRADLGKIPGAPVGQDVDTVNQAIRAGIPYGPEVSEAENSSGVTRKQRGLAFGESEFCCPAIKCHSYISDVITVPLTLSSQLNISHRSNRDSASSKSIG